MFSFKSYTEGGCPKLCITKSDHTIDKELEGVGPEGNITGTLIVDLIRLDECHGDIGESYNLLESIVMLNQDIEFCDSTVESSIKHSNLTLKFHFHNEYPQEGDRECYIKMDLLIDDKVNRSFETGNMSQDEYLKLKAEFTEEIQKLGFYVVQAHVISKKEGDEFKKRLMDSEGPESCPPSWRVLLD